MPDTSDGCWTMFFKPVPPCGEFRETTRVPLPRHSERCEEPHNPSSRHASKPKHQHIECVASFSSDVVLFRGFERSLALLGMTTQCQIRSSSKSYTSNQ